MTPGLQRGSREGANIKIGMEKENFENILDMKYIASHSHTLLKQHLKTEMFFSKSTLPNSVLIFTII